MYVGEERKLTYSKRFLCCNNKAYKKCKIMYNSNSVDQRYQTCGVKARINRFVILVVLQVYYTTRAKSSPGCKRHLCL